VPLLVVAVLALAFVGWMVFGPALAERRRARRRAKPFPREWARILRRRVPLFRRLPADLQLQLKKHIQVFLAEKSFIGCRGLVVTDEVRVTIAAQACLLLLNRPQAGCFPNLRQVLVYPGAFVTDRVHTNAGGVAQDQRRVLSGESWSQGQVILSWQDSLDGAAVPDDGRNVVIHEFAHQLDQETGPANGAPALPGRERLRRWAEVFNLEFDRLRERLRQGEASLFGEYAALDPAEFFAVASELFFEQPQHLADAAPALYRELSGFYRVDPASW
jgi:Mlc titration factor MtfA (ptsG expression regulator)